MSCLACHKKRCDRQASLLRVVRVIDVLWHDRALQQIAGIDHRAVIDKTCLADPFENGRAVVDIGGLWSAVFRQIQLQGR